MPLLSRIMVVEDELIIAHDIARTLERLGYVVSAVVGDSEDALTQAKAQRPDIVLMDIQLSGAHDGVYAASTLMEFQAVPVIFLTAYSDEDR